MLYTGIVSILAGLGYAALQKKASQLHTPLAHTGFFIARLALMALLTVLLLHTSRIKLILGLLIFFAFAWYHILKEHRETI